VSTRRFEVEEDARELIFVGFRSFRMFEFNMDEYLDEEIDWVKDAMAKICKEWDQQVRRSSSFRRGPLVSIFVR